MRRYFFFVAHLVSALFLVSCESPISENPMEGDRYLKNILLDFSNTETRSNDSGQEFQIYEFTVFLERLDPDGNVRFHDVLYSDDDDILLPLYFSDNWDYEYYIYVIANAGNLSEFKNVDDVILSRVNDDPLNPILAGRTIWTASEGDIIVKLSSVGSLVTLDNLTLKWNVPANGCKPLTIKNVWVSESNTECSFTRNKNLPFISYSGSINNNTIQVSVDEEINDGETVSPPNCQFVIYGENGKTLSLIIECEWNGSSMYYNLPFTIHEGVYNKLSYIITDVGTLSLSDSIKPESLIPDGVFILHAANRFYSANEWTSMSMDNKFAVGVVVGDGTHAFVVHPTQSKVSMKWSHSSGVQVSGVAIKETIENAVGDFNGLQNTLSLIEAKNAGLITSIAAAQYASSAVFLDGRLSYQPSAGEMKMMLENSDLINECLTAIGGTAIPSSTIHLVSTEKSTTEIWTMYYSTNNSSVITQSLTKGSNSFGYVRAVGVY